MNSAGHAASRWLVVFGIVSVVTTLTVAQARSTSSGQAPRAVQRPATTPYYPERFDWRKQTPEQARVDAAKLDEAIKFAVASENDTNKDLAVEHATSGFGREPFDAPIGPFKPRGALNGIIIKNGYVVAEWGETTRVDMTFSVTKSFLSTVVGLMWQKGLIRDVTDPVRDYMPTAELFEGPHNSKITWEHLLRQTSDWQGTLWGKPDWADRPQGPAPSWPNRKLNEPGSFYKYNDVRVNVLALAALQVLRRPLPEFVRDEIMEPIGASSTWRWHGYENSWIDLDGRRVQSMTGGGHWGGGMFISARDMARFGYLFLRNGKWQDRQIVSQKWIDMARSPGPANDGYGYMNWFLNSGAKRPFASAPTTAVTFQGNGSNIIYIDWQNDVVVVVRWIRQDAFNEFIGKVLGALGPAAH
jgi:CubicO group peptidase (beta-lactamase class C family)